MQTGENGRGSNEERTMESNPGDLREPAPTTISIHMDKLIQDVALYTYIGMTMRKASLSAGMSIQWETTATCLYLSPRPRKPRPPFSTTYYNLE